jgi:hypothetical protein
MSGGVVVEGESRFSHDDLPDAHDACRWTSNHRADARRDPQFRWLGRRTLVEQKEMNERRGTLELLTTWRAEVRR